MLRPIAKFYGQLEAENQPKSKERKQKTENTEAEADCSESFGFLVELGRKRIAREFFRRRLRERFFRGSLRGRLRILGRLRHDRRDGEDTEKKQEAQEFTHRSSGRFEILRECRKYIRQVLGELVTRGAGRGEARTNRSGKRSTRRRCRQESWQ